MRPPLFYTSTKKSSAGFTLVELLIVIAIIALLASIIIPNLIQAREKARSSRAVSFAKQINNVLALQENKNVLAILDTTAAPGPDGAQADGYVEPYHNSSFKVYTGAGNQPIWSSDTPTGQGFSFKADSAGSFFCNTSVSCIVTNYAIPAPSNDGFTVSFWLKKESENVAIYNTTGSGATTNTNDVLTFSFSDTVGVKSIVIATSTTGISTTLRQSSMNAATYTHAQSLALHKWYHYVVSLKEDRLTYYIDGVKVYDNQSAGVDMVQLDNMKSLISTGAGLYFGYLNGTNVYRLYDFKLWENYFDPSNP